MRDTINAMLEGPGWECVEAESKCAQTEQTLQDVKEAEEAVRHEQFMQEAAVGALQAAVPRMVDACMGKAIMVFRLIVAVRVVRFPRICGPGVSPVFRPPFFRNCL